jgi:hypothetical protein
MTQAEAQQHVLGFLGSDPEEWKTSSAVDWHLIAAGKKSIGTTDAALYALREQGLVEMSYVPGFDMVTARDALVPGWRLSVRPPASVKVARPRLRLSPLAA